MNQQQAIVSLKQKKFEAPFLEGLQHTALNPLNNQREEELGDIAIMPSKPGDTYVPLPEPPKTPPPPKPAPTAKQVLNKEIQNHTATKSGKTHKGWEKVAPETMYKRKLEELNEKEARENAE